MVCGRLTADPLTVVGGHYRPYDPLTDPATIVINEEKALHCFNAALSPRRQPRSSWPSRAQAGEGEEADQRGEPEGGGEKHEGPSHHMAQAIVGLPGQVVVTEEMAEDHIVYHLKVADSDMVR